MKIAIGINGAGGRMGQRLVALGKEDPALKIACALEYHGHPMMGKMQAKSQASATWAYHFVPKSPLIKLLVPSSIFPPLKAR